MSENKTFYITDEEGNCFGSNLKYEEAIEKAKKIKAEEPEKKLFVDVEDEIEIITQNIF